MSTPSRASLRLATEPTGFSAARPSDLQRLGLWLPERENHAAFPQSGSPEALEAEVHRGLFQAHSAAFCSKGSGEDRNGRTYPKYSHLLNVKDFNYHR